jgi:hypothetical protein
MYVTLRAWRANEGGTTDLPDYSKLSHVTERFLKIKLQTYTTPRNGTYILCAPSMGAGIEDTEIFQRVKVPYGRVGEAR